MVLTPYNVPTPTVDIQYLCACILDTEPFAKTPTFMQPETVS